MEKVVALEGLQGSADSSCVTPVAPPVSSVSISDAGPPVVSEVVLPSSPAVTDAKLSSVAVSHESPPSLPPPSQSSAAEEPLPSLEDTASLPAAETEAQDASLIDRTSSSSLTNDVASQPTLTKTDSSSQLQDAADEATAVSPVPVLESS